jgi:DNA polymerase-3 subunit delta'
MLRPLGESDVARAVAAAPEVDAAADDIRAAAKAAGGSVGRAVSFLEGDALELRQQVIELLDRLPVVDPLALHAMADAVAGAAAEPLAALTDAVNAWLSERLRTEPQQAPRLARIAEVWTSVNNAARDAEAYNLDRKPLVFFMFDRLAEAARA